MLTGVTVGLCSRCGFTSVTVGVGSLIHMIYCECEFSFRVYETNCRVTQINQGSLNQQPKKSAVEDMSYIFL